MKHYVESINVTGNTHGWITVKSYVFHVFKHRVEIEIKKFGAYGED